ncbi:MAG: glycosyltransferase [Candidatus Rickettsiella isopodorum]|nr:glycosyltransferase [Candidatus Rickettsiella isopodorum]
MKDVLFITSGGINKPSSRQRVFQYLPFLAMADIRFSVTELRENKIVNLFTLLIIIILMPLHKLIFFQKIYKRKVFLHKIAKLLHKKVIFDLDDAVFVENNSNTASSHKDDLDFVLNLADTVIVGNEYLKNYCSQYTNKIIMIPTLLDEEYYQPSKLNEEAVLFGWIGTSLNQKNFLPIINEIIDLLERKKQKLILISDKNKLPQNKHIKFIKWQLNQNKHYFSLFSIGLMPLENNDWNKGKCSFKLLEYLFMGKPAIASSIGMNREVLNEFKNGYLAESLSDFPRLMMKMIENEKTLLKNANMSIKSLYEKYGLHHQHHIFLDAITQLLRDK